MPRRQNEFARLFLIFYYFALADGIITPAISVLSAVGGLSNIPPPAGLGVTQPVIVGVSCAILAILFLFQVGAIAMRLSVPLYFRA